MDGHRACGVRLEPAETIAHRGICPVCGSPVTVGVSHRVQMLADRSEAKPHRPPPPAPWRAWCRCRRSCPRSSAAASPRRRLAGCMSAPLRTRPGIVGAGRDTDRGHRPHRLPAPPRRQPGCAAATVIRQAGYDGEYGVIRLFEDGELSATRRATSCSTPPVSRRAPHQGAGPTAASPGGRTGAPARPRILRTARPARRAG